MSEVLNVKDLKLYYRTLAGIVRAVDGVSFTLRERETLAVIGESGCGKTSLARALVRFLPRNINEFSGSIILDGVEVMKLSDAEFDKQVRWKKIAYVTQAAINSLNPVIKVVDHLIEPLILHLDMSKNDAVERAKEAIKKVGIVEDFLWRYPFELSGGMRQRIVIALSIITNPRIVILDEPTSALDVMTQANIINLLKELKQSENLSFIFITHDIAVSSELSDKVAVMYAGQIVELGSAEKMYIEPLHPYSKGLLNSVPRIHSDKQVVFIPGTPPSLINPPSGCRFYPRCPYAMSVCEKNQPPLVEISSEEYVRCWLYAEK
ncbi:MAG: ABC transporter ATP-binding protein [Ignisphaera sp.]|uniref:ABC transporter ATP-binding protein n=1 Tax=Ignisphaera aggregans TaxID=334771 RepID=A0A7C4JK53_9CREN